MSLIRLATLGLLSALIGAHGAPAWAQATQPNDAATRPRAAPPGTQPGKAPATSADVAVPARTASPSTGMKPDAPARTTPAAVQPPASPAPTRSAAPAAPVPSVPSRAAPAATPTPAATRAATAAGAATAAAPSGSSRTPAAGSRVDINTATEAQLDSLPGIGPARAKAIIAGRPYEDIKDLETKKVLSAGVVAGVRDRIALANINTSSAAELQRTLPGIGDVRSKAIVAGRPYASPEDLVTKKVLTQGTLDGIMDKIAY